METLKPLVDQLVEMIKQGKDVIGGQLPDVASQILAYSAFQDRAWMWAVGCIFVFALPLFIYGIVSSNDSEGSVVFGFLGISLSVLCFVLNYVDLIKIRLAPKLYLIEVIKGFLK